MAQDPLHLLCIEPRFPGRLGAVADWLVRKRGYRCQFYCASAEPQEHWPEATGRGMDVVQFNVGGVAREPSVPWARHLERGLCYAFGCWEVLDARRPRPVDVVLGRSAGLGSTLFAPVYAPAAPVVQLFDYYLHPHANDLADETPRDELSEYFQWRYSANAMDLLDLENGVTPWAATDWQRGLYPAEYRDDFTVLFDGVDTRRFRPAAGAPRVVAGRPIPPETKVVTFVSRFLDRVRGFDRFMALANRLVRERSDVLCLVVGGPIVLRGLDVENYGKNYQAQVLARDPPPDPSRVVFLGTPRPSVVAEVLAASDLHVVPSRVYPVSRSLVEAMASACVVLAWDTEPVREFLADGTTARLVPADDPDAAARAALVALDDPAGHRPLGEVAAALVRERFAHDVTLPQLALLFDRLVDERFPPVPGA